ncbi:DUF1616 domain-containing protein [Natronococcus sp. A-GB1]|uniref:DUF1616 domain-containing protein n=1 Tax=Natronococcus sp. A-GB1 TaxID=3037648 RepID=UPI00241C0CCD|nr:DUF1616 domain-containing protein [Natronococcus sp. A-GB1]MDG5761823.1 DUF1616 domain-containing protein [Natronococcus sp. A-GB1]
MGANGRTDSNRGWWLDLAVALLVTGLVIVAAVAPELRETPVRVVFGLPFLLFVPGYVAVAALFPERERSGLDGIDRLSLSVVASVIVVAVTGLAMSASPWGVGLGPTLAAVALVTVALTAGAARRRLAVSPADRFRVPYREWARTGTSALRPTGVTDLALTLSLAVAVAIAVGAVGFAIADHHAGYGPDLGEDDDAAAISLLDSDGDLLTDGSDVTLEQGSADSVFVGVDNYGDEPKSYTVLALEQELEDGATEDERELERFDVTVSDGESETFEHELEPATGDDVQFVWLLYPDAVPEEPSIDSADAYVSLTVGSEEADG